MSVSLRENYELQGAVIGLGVTASLKIAGRSLSESLTIGSAVGMVTAASMKTFGQPEIVKQIVNRVGDAEQKTARN